MFSFSERVGDFYDKKKGDVRVIGYDNKEQFLFATRGQKNHKYNLEETMLLLII